MDLHRGTSRVMPTRSSVAARDRGCFAFVLRRCRSYARPGQKVSSSASGNTTWARIGTMAGPDGDATRGCDHRPRGDDVPGVGALEFDRETLPWLDRVPADVDAYVGTVRGADPGLREQLTHWARFGY